MIRDERQSDPYLPYRPEPVSGAERPDWCKPTMSNDSESCAPAQSAPEVQVVHRDDPEVSDIHAMLDLLEGSKSDPLVNDQLMDCMGLVKPE